MYSDVLQNLPGKTEVTKHHILTGNATPVRLPPYRLENGIVEVSTSNWAAPIVLEKRKDGSLRLCVDYRRLNSVSQFDAYPMPRVDDLIDQIGQLQAKFIFTLDLTRGYWQVPVAEEARHKTAFITPFGLFQFIVMPFGLSGAPATFQQMMDHLLRGSEEFALAYLDDLVVYTSSWEDHLQCVRLILDKLRRAGLTAKPKKCQFGMAECVYLGHVVGSGVVRPEKSKVEAVKLFPAPKTKKKRYEPF